MCSDDETPNDDLEVIRFLKSEVFSGIIKSIFKDGISDLLKVVYELEKQMKGLHGRVSYLASEMEKLKINSDKLLAEESDSTYSDDNERFVVGCHNDERLVGTVKWFNMKVGYGFIVREDNNEIYVHQNAILKRKNEHCVRLEGGQRVSFEIKKGEKGLEAKNVTDADGKKLKGFASITQACKSTNTDDDEDNKQRKVTRRRRGRGGQPNAGEGRMSRSNSRMSVGSTRSNYSETTTNTTWPIYTTDQGSVGSLENVGRYPAEYQSSYRYPPTQPTNEYPYYNYQPYGYTDGRI